MPAPREILELVDRFDRNSESYRSPDCNEATLRVQFLDPFFKALGWDVHNEQGTAEPYKDVLHEESIRVGGATKAPDYCFRYGCVRKFFVEAKRPAVNIALDAAPAFQLRSYAWSAKLPLSILTDFEEFAVYDCRVPPRPNDNPATARIMLLSYTEYVERWDELAAIFSRESVRQGAFDKFVESKKVKKGTQEVDAAFLQEIESWRDKLARSFAQRNPQLTPRELNFAVQRTIDRIIFLRIAEARLIEDHGRLLALTNGEHNYKRLCEHFERADERYNSGLFHFHKERDRAEPPDELTLALKIDDSPLREIIQSLYYPKSPYEFSVLPADILGQVYEQFLGKVIRLTAGHRAVVDDKPEVKKAGGVYYTPTYIVDYMVQQTVGKLLETKSPREAAKLRILDPACGSGSFLIGAYQFLLDWHLKWYTEHGPAQLATGRQPKIFQGPGGRWRLTTTERKRILLANIHGVDIDTQAVEVTKLSLLLKVLEGESRELLERQRRLLHERALPDLGRNIKCGNSLIGPDFYNGQQMSLLDDDKRYRINVFDWHSEFSEIMKSGGFDAVIGNPPYVRQESLSDFKEYFEKHYEASDSVADLYAYFMEKGVKLLREGGLFSIIVSSSFLRATYGEPLRRTLKKHAAVLRIVDFGGLAVFANAKDTYVCIPLLAKGAKQKRVEVSKVDSLELQDLTEQVAANHFTIPHDRLTPEAWSLKSDAEAAVFRKVMKAGKPLGDYVERRLFYGIKTGLNEAFDVSAAQRAKLVRSSSASKAIIKPFLSGQDIRRYFVNDKDRHFIVIPCGWTRKQMLKARKPSTDFTQREAWRWLSQQHPKIAEHLEPFTAALRKRQDQGDYWWELRPCDYYEVFDAPKIIFPDICKGPRFYLDRTGVYLGNTAYCLGTDDLYLLGVLNSRLFWFAISHISIPFGIRAGQYRYRLIYQYMERVPIRVINFSVPADKSRHDRIVEMAKQMPALHQKRMSARTTHERTTVERQIDATDRQIDKLVYDLYGLTEKEIAIVESATASRSADAE